MVSVQRSTSPPRFFYSTTPKEELDRIHSANGGESQGIDRKGKAKAEGQPAEDDRQLTVRSSDSSTVSRYEAGKIWETPAAPQYRLSQETLKEQAQAYERAGGKLADFLKGCLGASWERQWFTSAEQIPPLRKWED